MVRVSCVILIVSSYMVGTTFALPLQAGLNKRLVTNQDSIRVRSDHDVLIPKTVSDFGKDAGMEHSASGSSSSLVTPPGLNSPGWSSTESSDSNDSSSESSLAANSSKQLEPPSNELQIPDSAHSDTSDADEEVANYFGRSNRRPWENIPRNPFDRAESDLSDEVFENATPIQPPPAPGNVNSHQPLMENPSIYAGSGNVDESTQTDSSFLKLVFSVANRTSQLLLHEAPIVLVDSINNASQILLHEVPASLISSLNTAAQAILDPFGLYRNTNNEDINSSSSTSSESDDYRSSVEPGRSSGAGVDTDGSNIDGARVLGDLNNAASGDGSRGYHRSRYGDKESSL